MKQSAGVLLYRRTPDGDLEILLVHPSGNYNRRAPWSIPKGVPDPEEELEACARRETLEETGVQAGQLHPLGYVTYRKSGKRVYGFASPAPSACQPTCASWEVDRAEFVGISQAREQIHPEQRPLLDRLLQFLEQGGHRSGSDKLP